MLHVHGQAELGPNNDFNNISIDYNAYAEAGAILPDFGYYLDGVTAGTHDLTGWQSKGWDVHIDTMNSASVMFTNLGDTSYTGYYTNLGRKHRNAVARAICNQISTRYGR